MSIQFNSNAPDDIQHKLTGWIPTFEQAAADLGLPEDVEFTLSQGYQVNYPSIRQIESGQLLCGSRRSSWRFMVFGSNQLIGEIELDDQHNPVTFYQGAGKEGLLSALTQAEAETDEYQFSLILVPALKFSGLWLQSANQDVVVPFEPNQNSLQNLQQLEPRDVLIELQNIIADLGLSDDLGG